MIGTQRTVVFRFVIEEISGFLTKLLYAVAYVVHLRRCCGYGGHSGCCHPPLADSAPACRRSRAVCALEYVKDHPVMRSGRTPPPARRQYYTIFGLKLSNRDNRRFLRRMARADCGIVELWKQPSRNGKLSDEHPVAMNNSALDIYIIPQFHNTHPFLWPTPDA